MLSGLEGMLEIMNLEMTTMKRIRVSIHLKSWRNRVVDRRTTQVQKIHKVRVFLRAMS